MTDTDALRAKWTSPSGPLVQTPLEWHSLHQTARATILGLCDDLDEAQGEQAAQAFGIGELQTRIANLLTVLEPFVEVADAFRDWKDDEIAMERFNVAYRGRLAIMVGMLRRAREVFVMEGGK